jgi:hemerythrin superfamily protein
MSCDTIWTVIRTIWWIAMGHQWSVDHSLRNTLLGAIIKGTRQDVYFMYAFPNHFTYAKIVLNLN